MEEILDRLIEETGTYSIFTKHADYLQAQAIREELKEQFLAWLVQKWEQEK